VHQEMQHVGNPENPETLAIEEILEFQFQTFFY
jgi:hypothetical protein